MIIVGKLTAVDNGICQASLFSCGSYGAYRQMIVVVFVPAGHQVYNYCQYYKGQYSTNAEAAHKSHTDLIHYKG